MFGSRVALQLFTLTQLQFATVVFCKYFGCMRAEEALDLLKDNVKVSPKGNWQIILKKHFL